MIGKVAAFGKGFKGCLQYNILGERRTEKENVIRGEFIYAQHLDSIFYSERPIECSIDDLVSEFHQPLQKIKKIRVQNPVLHQSLSFPPGEKVENEVLVKICGEFSKWFGLEENQMVVYKHSDKRHEHIHIVANRLNIHGVNSYRSGNNFYETGKFCRFIEQKYGLQKTKQMDSLKIDGKDVLSENKLHVQLRTLIDKFAGEVENIDQLRHALLRKGWKTYIGRGISFVHKPTGTTVKGSALGRNYSLSGLGRLIEGSRLVAGDTDPKGERRPERELLKGKISKNSLRATDLNMFVALMKVDGYGVHFRDYKNKVGEEKKSIAFSKSFSAKPNSSKYVTGLELGPSFGFYNISRNIGAAKWTDVLPSPTRPVIQKDQTKPNIINSGLFNVDHIAIGLNELLTSHNAGKVESDAARSVARVEAEFARNVFGDKNLTGLTGREEWKKKRLAKSKAPKLR
jgi:hypothetical protein